MPPQALRGASVFPMGNWDPERRRRTGPVNDWLRGWCLVQGFGYFDLGQAFEKMGMWAADGLQLSKWGTSAVGSRLSGLITSGLNWVSQGKGGELDVTEKGWGLLSLLSLLKIGKNH